MKNLFRWCAGAATVSVLVITACAGPGSRMTQGEPIIPGAGSYAGVNPDSVSSIPPGVVTEFPIPTASDFPAYITSAAGALWFTEYQSNKIGRVTTAGAVTEFSAGSAAGPYDIITGPDGRPWFGALTANGLGRIGSSGGITFVPIPTASGHPEQLVADNPHNSIWFAERIGQKIGVYDLTTHAITEYNVPVPTGGIAPRPTGIALDNSGNVWFSDSSNDQVDEMSTDGTLLQRLTLPGSAGPFSLSAWYMALGNDGDLWLTEITGGPAFKGAIARINPLTLAIKTLVPLGPAPTAVGIAAGPGGIWLPPEGGGRLIRAKHDGTIKEWKVPGSSGYGITEGPDQNMWFVDFNTNAIAQVKVGLLP